MRLRCSTHEAPATHGCDSCGRLLCEGCFEVGHRLLFCAHCGERAAPLDERGPANAGEVAREKVRRTPFTPRTRYYVHEHPRIP